MKTIEVRFAAESDAEALLEIYAPYVRETAITFELEAPGREEFAERIRTFGEDYPYLVCQVDGKMMGYAYAHRMQERAAYQWNAELSVYLAPEAAGKGMGTALYRALIELLALQGVQNVYGLVTVPNAASEALHARMGFAAAGAYRRTGYKLGQWRDVLIFEKHIGAEGEPRPLAAIGTVEKAAVEAVLRDCETEIRERYSRRSG
ncbi:MAG: GNAT family N-acetyltransferase [Oscillospiraceae bacterium]|jgi:L-amino acid N-acyltransferase YncA